MTILNQNATRVTPSAIDLWQWKLHRL